MRSVAFVALLVLAGCADPVSAVYGTVMTAREVECNRPLEERKEVLRTVRRAWPGKEALDCDGDGQPDFELAEE